MAWVERLITRTTQPQDGAQLDPAFPLVPLAVVNGADFSFNLADKSPLTRGSGVAKSASVAGVGVRQTSANSHLTQSGKVYPSTSYTAVWSGVFLGAHAGSTPQLIGLASSASTQDTGIIQLRIETATTFTVVFRGVAANASRVFTGSKSTNYGGLSTVVAAVDFGRQEVRLTVFQDGLITSYASTLTGAAATVTGSEIFVLGPDLIESPTRYANAAVNHGAIYAGAIGAEFERSLAKNPWQIFEPEVSRIWVDDYVSAGGGATTISSDASASYAIRAAITSDAAASYPVRSATSSDTTAAYPLRAATQSDAAAAYAIRSAASADALASYYVLGLVQSDATGSYAVRSAAQSDALASYAVRSAVQSDALASYEILSAGVVFSDSPASYTIRAAVQADAAASYPVRSVAQADAAGAYAVRSAVWADAGASYAVQGALVAVWADATCSYFVDGVVVDPVVLPPNESAYYQRVAAAILAGKASGPNDALFLRLARRRSNGY